MDRAGSRTRRAMSHAAWGLVARALSIAAVFAAMPLMLRLLGQESLGAWLVLLAVFQWVTFFDFGVAAGARNEIARVAAVSSAPALRQTIYAGWAYVGAASLVIFLVLALLLGATPLADFAQIQVFNGQRVGAALWIVLSAACLSLLLGYVQSIYAALEKASAMSMFSLLANGGFLLLLWCATVGRVSLAVADIALLYAAAIVVANLILIGVFWARHPPLRPMRVRLDPVLRGKILNFGLRLFVVQLAALVLFTTDRLLVSTLISPAHVVAYDAALKVFSVVLMTHTLVMSTLWSAFTHAQAGGDWVWIRRTLSRLIKLMLPLSVGCGLLALAAPWLIRAWLGAGQVGPVALYWTLAAVTVVSCWSNVFAFLHNGLGETRVQLFTSVAAMVMNPLAAWFFVRVLDWGMPGIATATLLSLSLFAIAGPLSTRRLIAGKEES